MEHGPKGGIGGVAEIREYATLDGGKIGEGEDAKASISLPPWFTRTGRITFEINTGFGVLKCKAIPLSEAKIATMLTGDEDSDLTPIFNAIIEVPEWEAETDTTIGSVTFQKGDPFPPLEDVKGKAARNDFVRRALPPSAIVQIATGLRYTALPPIPYTEADPS